MTEIITSAGLRAEVDEESLNDMALLDLLAETAEGSPFTYSKIADLLIGKEKRLELYDLLRRKDGRVPIDEFCDQVTEIMKQLQSKKK